eukprot:3321829-Rhodomonas_salina.2
MQGPLGLRCVARAELWVVNAEERRGVGCWRRAGHVGRRQDVRDDSRESVRETCKNKDVASRWHPAKEDVRSRVV